MAYELPVIKNTNGNTIKVAHPTLPDGPLTYLTDSVLAAGVTLTILDNNGFTQNDNYAIGKFGIDKTEIKKINAAVTTGTSLTTTALTFDHAIDTPVQFILWDQVEISGATTLTGTKTVIVTMNIQADRTDTTYVNTGTTYAYYFARFKNSVTSTYSSYSDGIAAAGYEANTVRSVKNSALNLTNEKISDLITEDFLNREILNCEQEVWSSKKQWSWTTEYDYILGDTAEGGIRIALPSDVQDPNSNKSIITLRIADRQNLDYLTKEEWDRRMQDIKYTILSTSVSLTNTSIVLTDSSDFDDDGSVTIGANSYTYTANDRTTNTLTISSSSTTNTAGEYVWSGASYAEPRGYTVIDGYIYFDKPVDDTYAEKNVYLSYFRKPSTVNSDNDTLNIPDYTVYHYYLAWKIMLKKNNGTMTNDSESFNQKYEMRKLNLMRQDRTGQRIKMTPRLNRLNYGDRQEVIYSNPQP